MNAGDHGPCRLVLLGHGQSEWNALDLFTGWVNVGLTVRGEREAGRAGQLLAGNDLLPAVHALIKHRVSDAEIVGLDIPTGIPLAYELGADMRPATRGGRYLDQRAAAKSIEAIRGLGRCHL